mgnify:CR=1 FL=1
MRRWRTFILNSSPIQRRYRRICKLLNEIREATRHLINIQTEGCSEEELVAGQKVLNDKYDKFVAKHGAITSQNNARAFRDDSDYPLLCSLEEIDEDGNVKKADKSDKKYRRHT